MADDEDGLVLVFGEKIRCECGEVQGTTGDTVLGNESLGSSAGATKRAECDRVAAGLGGEVAAEAEHVDPLAEQFVRGL